MNESKKNNRSSFLIRNSTTVLVTKLGLILIKLATGVVTARILGPNGKGILVLAFQLPGMLATFSNLSLGDAIIYNLGKGKISKGTVLGNILLFTFVVSAVVLSVIFYILPYLSNSFLKNIDLNILKISLFLMPLVILDYLCLATLKGVKRFALYNGLSLFSRTLFFIAIFTALVIFGAGIKVAVTAYFSAFLFSILVVIGTLFVIFEKKLAVSGAGLISLIKYGSVAHVGIILTELEYRFDVFILNFFLMPAYVGIYSVGVTVAQLLWYISNSITTVIFPEISSISKTEAAKFLPKVCRNVFFICGIIGVFLAMTGYYFIHFFYGIEYVLAYPVLLILLPGLIMDSVFRTLSSYFKGTGRPFLVSKTVFLSLCLNLMLNFIFIPMWGIKGAAFSSLISYSFNAIILLFHFKKDREVKLSECLLINKDDLNVYYKLLKTIIRKQ